MRHTPLTRMTLLLTLSWGMAACVSSSPKKTEAQHARALAFAAIIARINHEPFEVLADVPITDELKKSTQKLLSDWWQVNSRIQLLDTLQWQENGGHRKILWEKCNTLRSVPIEKLPDELVRGVKDKDEFNRNLVAALSLRAPKRKVLDITAWDYGRYISLCRWGYVSGYISEQEAWEHIMPVARFLQASYSSWDEYADDYLRGREFWSLNQTIQAGTLNRETVKSLLVADGLWHKTAWDAPLGEGAVAEDNCLKPPSK